MASFDSLPSDQKAVLSLVLQHGRSFDQIAAMLGLDRARVRKRALEGFDLMGPDTGVPALKRALITDYLVGQLPPRVADSVRAGLAENPTERAWARIIAAEIAPLARNGLPEIPAADAPGLDAEAAAPATRPVRHDEPQAVGAGAPSTAAPARRRAATPVRSSRRGGAILLGAIAIVVIVVVVVLLVTGGSSKTAKTTSTATGTQTAASGTGTTATPLHQIDLTSPDGVSTVKGAADVVKAGGKLGLIILAQGLTPNTVGQNAYAVWLYNSQTGAKQRLGFYNDPVASSGRTKGELEAEVPLGTSASKYNQLLLTLETKTSKPPGTIVLEGAFAE